VAAAPGGTPARSQVRNRAEVVAMNLMDHPYLVFIVVFALLWLSTHIGHAVRGRLLVLQHEERDDFGILLTAVLTLLGLLIGFSFQMAISRYDLRKSCEENEVNAIATEYLRADLLSADQSAHLRSLLHEYLGQRLSFYTTTDSRQLEQIAMERTQLQLKMWSIVRPTPPSQPSIGSALLMAGMNEVMDTQRLANAAWNNRIPLAAWIMMIGISVCCTVLFGYRVQEPGWRLFVIMPLAVATAFLMISDIDSPRSGAIRVAPDNLAALSQVMQVP
jgi:hypothetical protein